MGLPRHSSSVLFPSCTAEASTALGAPGGADGSSIHRSSWECRTAAVSVRQRERRKSVGAAGWETEDSVLTCVIAASGFLTRFATTADFPPSAATGIAVGCANILSCRVKFHPCRANFVPTVPTLTLPPRPLQGAG